MKKLLSILIALVLAFAVTACGGNSASNSTGSDTNDSTNGSTSQTQNTSVNPTSSATSVLSSEKQSTEDTATSANQKLQNDANAVIAQAKNATTKIYLAGDSTVKTYAENTYIAGWGQFLQYFLNVEQVGVINMAEGGRSSRSFINEGRLTKKTGSSRTPIEGNIKAGDYLMIQFAHNDEETNGDRFLNYIDRKVPLGTPDTNGIFPTTLPTLVSTETLPTEFEEGATETAKTSAKNVIKAYGSEYYSFDCGGTFKGYLKMYIDFARSVGATPILCTPVARVKYDSTGKTIIGGNGKHGPNFEYVLAVRQLATEENCLLIDTFDFSKRVLEQATIAEGNNFMALKPNSLIGLWPNDYDVALSGNGAKYTGIEGTHYNKYGAYLQAAFIADEFAKMAENNTTASGTEKITFGSSVLSTPTRVVVPSSRIKAETTTAISQFFTKVNVA